MLLFLLPFLAATNGVMSNDDAATPPSDQVCADVGLSAMLAETILDQRGVQTLKLKGPETDSSGEEFHFMSFRSARRVAVQLKFFGRTPLSGKATKASLSAPNHSALRVVEVREVALDLGTEATQIIVEAEAQAHEARGVYTLELQDAEGTKLLVLPGVRFPSI